MGCQNSKNNNKYKINTSLKSEVLKILLSFGETGLYKSQSVSDTEDFKKFKQFCCGLKNRLIDSPRNVLLKKLTLKANNMYDTYDEVKELYKIIGLNEKVNFIIVLNYMDNLSPGKEYAIWNVYKSKAVYIPLTDEEKEEAINNKKHKMLFREQDISTFDEESFLQSIEKTKSDRCKKSRQSAEDSKKLLDTDKEYQDYLKAKSIWSKYGFDNMEEEFNDIDTTIGDDRRIRGRVFEETKGKISFNYIRDYLINKTGYNFVKEGIKSHYNCYWIDERNVRMGEIDILLTYNDVPIAIGELKSNCFDIVAGYNQHKTKIDAGYKILLKSKKKIEISKKIPIELFLITLIPEHTHLIGTESKLVKMIGDSISSLGLYGRSKPYEEFTLEDFIAFRDEVRTKLYFDISPDKYLMENWDKIIIFDRR